MGHLVKPWVNRVGIVLEFLSFWLAAPEILGEERLKALERGVEKGMKLLYVMLIFPGIMYSGFIVAPYLMPSDVKSFPMWKKAIFMVMVLYLGVGLAGVILGWELLSFFNRLARPLLKSMADDERIRQRSLAVGAMLFVVGFLLQLVATF